MMRSSRGAARISAVWMIAVGVLFLAALVFAFIAQSDLANQQDRVTASQADMKVAQTEATAQSEKRRDLSQLLGWYNRESADPESEIESVKAALEDLRTAFPDISATDTDFQSVLPKIRAAFDLKAQKIDELNTRISALEGEVAAANQAAIKIRDDKDGVIAELRQQYADLEARLSERETDLNRRLATSQDELSERDASLRDTVAVAEESERQFRREKRVLGTRIDTLAEATKLSREPFSELPDGKVVDVSDRTSYGYIDLGADHRVTRGLRFRIESSASGGARVKAWAEVSKVFPDYSEIRIYNLADRFDPVVPGDVLVNPLFDPDGERTAVLVGRFSGSYTEGEVGSLLQRMGIVVQDRLDIRTNYMIVGSELYVDAETGEPLEEPISPFELPIYKEAQNLGVVVIPLEQLRDYFRVYAS